MPGSPWKLVKHGVTLRTLTGWQSAGSAIGVGTGEPTHPASKSSTAIRMGRSIPLLLGFARLLSQRGAVKAIANVDTGKAGNYLTIAPIMPYRNKDLVSGETINFAIEGIPTAAKGITAEAFLDTKALLFPFVRLRRSVRERGGGG